jgi:hypothetical protein
MHLRPDRSETSEQSVGSSDSPKTKPVWHGDCAGSVPAGVLHPPNPASRPLKPLSFSGAPGLFTASGMGWMELPGCRKVGKQTWGDLEISPEEVSYRTSIFLHRERSVLEFTSYCSSSLQSITRNQAIDGAARACRRRRLEPSYTGAASFGTMNKSCDEIPVRQSLRPRESPKSPPEPPMTQVPPPEVDSPPTTQSPFTSPGTARPVSSMTTQTIAMPEDQQDIEADDVGLFVQTQPC